MKKTLIIITALFLLLSGCSLSNSTQSKSTPIPISSILLNSDPNIAPTLTPFQPMLPTSTPGVVIAPTATPLPATIETQTQVTTDNTLTRPSGQVNILILGSDYRPNRGFRTDVIMLLSLNPEKGTATLTSFPRDLYVTIPGVGMERINTAQAYGGFSLTAATFETNFNVQPDYYMMTNFDGFKGIIDTLGGIDVSVASTLTDECSIPEMVDSNGNCTIYADTNHMDGQTALWYVRSRYSSSDFDRTRRAQEVLQALFQKLMSLDAINRSAELYSMFTASVETNIPLSSIVSLLPLGSQLLANPSQLRKYAIGANETYDYIVPGSGAMVLIPDQNAVTEIIRQAIYQ